MAVDSIVLNYLEKGFVGVLDEPAINLSLNEHQCSSDVQNKEARSDLSPLVSLESVVYVYVGLPDVSLPDCYRNLYYRDFK